MRRTGCHERGPPWTALWSRPILRAKGVAPILACHLLTELGEAARFRRAREAVRAAGLDPVVDESGETRRRGRLAEHGAPVLRWALVEAAQHAQRANSPDHALHVQAAARVR